MNTLDCNIKKVNKNLTKEQWLINFEYLNNSIINELKKRDMFYEMPKRIIYTQNYFDQNCSFINLSINKHFYIMRNENKTVNIIIFQNNIDIYNRRFHFNHIDEILNHVLENLAFYVHY